MSSRLDQFRDYFPTTRIVVDDGTRILSRSDIHRRRLVMLAAFGAVLMFGFTLTQIVLLRFDTAAVARMAAGGFATGLCLYGVWLGLWGEHYENKLRFLLVIFSALAWLEVVLSGGISGYNAAILPIFPVVAALLLKTRDAVLFTGMHLVVIIVIAGLGIEIFPVLNFAPKTGLVLSVMMIMVGVTVSASSALYMAHQNEKVEGQLRELLIHQAYLAVHDYLSGLGNRVQLQQRFADGSEDDEFDILLIDLDGFKSINDTFGHEAGDYLIKSVSERLREVTDDADMLVRLGGDEFVILLENVDGPPPEVRRFGQHVIEVLSRPYAWNGDILRISASIGHARYPLHHETRSKVLGLADQSLYLAKNAGKGICVTHGEPPRPKPKRKTPRFILKPEPHTRFVES